MDNSDRETLSVPAGDQRAENAEPKHTPLPWRSERSKLNDLWTIYCGKGKNIAAVHDPYGHDDAVAAANAALIVAAVNSHADMLAALQLTLSALEHWFRHGNPDWDGSAGDGSLIGDARAAISKATGAAS